MQSSAEHVAGVVAQTTSDSSAVEHVVMTAAAVAKLAQLDEAAVGEVAVV